VEREQWLVSHRAATQPDQHARKHKKSRDVEQLQSSGAAGQAGLFNPRPDVQPSLPPSARMHVSSNKLIVQIPIFGTAHARLTPAQLHCLHALRAHAVTQDVHACSQPSTLPQRPAAFNCW
jgi:hypothetical protein